MKYSVQQTADSTESLYLFLGWYGQVLPDFKILKPYVTCVMKCYGISKDRSCQNRWFRVCGISFFNAMHSILYVVRYNRSSGQRGVE